MYTTVLFDLDGTLLDTLQDLANAGNHALLEMGFSSHPANNYKKMVGNGIPKLIERMLPQANREEASQKMANKLFFAYYKNHLKDFTKPYPGIIQLLQTLKSKGIQLGVVTNKADEFAKQIVEEYFPNVFNIVIGCNNNVLPKPNPAGIYFAMQQTKAKAESTLYCGDSDVDMQTARQAGIDSCGVLWGFRSEQELAEQGALYLAKNTEQLKNIILQ